MKTLVLLSAMMALGLSARAGDYNPLTIDGTFRAERLELSVHDADRSRDLPLRVYLPASSNAAPVVLFSHGLGGSRAGSAFLGEHWAARGYVVVYLQHPGSDDAIWRNVEAGNRAAAMKQAVTLQNFVLRVEDVHAVLDQLEKWNADKSSPLAGRLDLKKIAMTGHSFGATTTEAVSGEVFPQETDKINDRRIKAAIAFSPSPGRTLGPAESFGSVKIPWLLMTGTKDVSPIGGIDVKARRSVYPALKGAAKYELVLDKAEHSVFTERALPGDKEPRNPNHHRAILALSTAFFDAWLRDDAAAKAWLEGPGARTVLEPADEWQFSDR